MLSACDETLNNPRTVLVAPLGGQPQVVTFALDLLLAQGVAVDEVVVIHLAAPRYRQAYRRLAEAFPGDRYGDRAIHLRGVPICARSAPWRMCATQPTPTQSGARCMN